MIKLFPAAALASALLCPAAALAGRAEAPAWIVTPASDSCRTELELVGASGRVVAAALVSDGRGVQLVFDKPDAPERAFLPIRIDRRPYSNLVLRQAGGRAAVVQLGPETVAALRKGSLLQIGWLSGEPAETRLTGSEQGVADLKACGAQVAARLHEQQAAERETQARNDAEARARALSEEQLAAAKAQTAAAEAEARRSEAEAARLQAAAEADRARVQAEADAARQRAEDQARSEAWPYARAGGYADPRNDYPQDSYGYEPPSSPYRRW